MAQKIENLMTALTAAGHAEVVMHYHGSNGSSNILEPHENGQGPLTFSFDLSEALHDYAYATIREHHDGWHRNEGGGGMLTVDVLKKVVRLYSYNNIVSQETIIDETIWY